jgi:hypothetical protein
MHIFFRIPQHCPTHTIYTPNQSHLRHSDLRNDPHLGCPHAFYVIVCNIAIIRSFPFGPCLYRNLEFQDDEPVFQHVIHVCQPQRPETRFPLFPKYYMAHESKLHTGMVKGFPNTARSLRHQIGSVHHTQHTIDQGIRTTHQGVVDRIKSSCHGVGNDLHALITRNSSHPL